MAKASKIPDDRTMRAKLRDLKTYNTYKARQMQAGGQEPERVEDALVTVETWSADANDDGQQWARAREVEANAKIAESESWQDRVRRDEKQAASDAEFRSKVDMNEVKRDLRKKLDDYEAEVRKQAEADQPWAKRKLVEIKKENAEARDFIDTGLEKSMDLSESKGREGRRKRRLVAEKMEARASEARAWKSEYSDQPAKWPEGQRKDVEAALGSIAAGTRRKAEDLRAFGGKAAGPVQSLEKVASWADELKPQVGSKGASAESAKVSGTMGVAEARAALIKVEQFETAREGEANENTELFRRWTDRNNALAKEWVNSKNADQRKWAEAWLETQKK